MEDEERYRAYMPGYEEPEAADQNANDTPRQATAARELADNEQPAEGNLSAPVASTAIDAPKGLVTTALTLSAVFSPLLVPTYAMAIALWITPLAILPEKWRFIFSLIIFGITAAIPMAVIIFMIRMGKVSDSAISNRKERGVPYLVTSVCYVAAALFLLFNKFPLWLVLFYGAACLSTLLALMINSVWKISAHATTMGGLCALILFIALRGYGIVWMLPWISGVLIFSGAVMSARLLLGRHTQGQVYAGWLMGLIIVFFCMNL